MQTNSGIFIVLEGSDGSGKGTQFRLLKERLKAVGHEVAVFDFPRYDEPSSYFVKQYLNGNYGPASEVSPYTASLFYALDRYETAPELKKALAAGKLVIANRYVGSNMAHQGTKFLHPAEQRGFFMWEDALEYQLLALPRPNINIYLRVSPETSYALVAQKAERSYTEKKRDEHEANIDHTKKAVAAYDLLCKLFPRDFVEIDCEQNGKLKSILEINDLIWKTITPLLPPPKHPGKGATLNLDSDPTGSNISKKPKTNTAQTHVKVRPDLPQDKLSKPLEQIEKLRQQLIGSTKNNLGTNSRALKEALKLTTPVSENQYLVSSIDRMAISAGNSEAPGPNDPQAMASIIKELAKDRLPKTDAENEPILAKITPRNEFELLDQSADTLTYQEKERKFKDELKRPGSKLLQRAVYHFDLLSDFGTLGYILQNGGKDIDIYGFGPNYGYSTPEIIEYEGMEEPYNRLFEKVNDLYTQLISDGQQKLAESILLLGHRVRWKVILSAAVLCQAKQSGEYKQFIGSILEKISESHPLIARAINDLPAATPKSQRNRSSASKNRRRGK